MLNAFALSGRFSVMRRTRPTSSTSTMSGSGESATPGIYRAGLRRGGGAQALQESRVGVGGDLAHFVLRTPFEGIGQHEHAEARMAGVRRHAVGERLEL